ncbi:tripartite motif-containing protein 59-like [Ruditapes philippinarum]|uniref:tripartite motif-containing protein 59-like n=1 Tax=Ruditapes philippinarum TaxID=129788 RepID=UPI00295BB80C|nr:tripartite motif-containing protein 59-like [Ruditapes philippinarum]
MSSQRLEQELECPICLERFDTPKVLPCQHTFCADCLINITQRGSVCCPECRVVHPVPPNGLPINIAIQRLLSTSKPSK